MTMATAAAPYVQWLSAASAQAEQVAIESRLSAGAFERRIRRDGAATGGRSKPGSADDADRDEHPGSKHRGNRGDRGRSTPRCGRRM